MGLTVSGLYCYPVKSCRGLSLHSAEIGGMGIRFDRQWMVVDERGMFAAQRGISGMGVGVKSMCLIETAMREEQLVLRAPGMPELSVPLAGLGGPHLEAQVWNTTCTAVDQGNEAARWFTEFLSHERPGTYRLVRMPDGGVRRTKRGEVALGFADVYSFLIISQPSLDDLNRRMPEPLPMDRFRPNIVIAGCQPYEEDHMAVLEIGDVVFEGTILCVRCAITTTNQRTAEIGKEPLKTLATYRKRENGVVFGRNFSHAGAGTIALGDPVEVLARD